MRVAVIKWIRQKWILPKCRTNRFCSWRILFWIKQVHRKENILDLKLVQISSSVLNKAFVQRRGIYLHSNGCEIAIASVLYHLKDQETVVVMKSMRGSWQAAKNTEELEGPNADLRNKKEETYRCRVAAEVHHVFLVKSGWCSGLSWRGRGDLRRRSSSGRETARGRKRMTEGENEEDLGRAYL